MNPVQKGKKGEWAAWRLLASKGYRLLHRNYRKGRAEVDLIVAKGNTVVFVEVKLRNSTAFGHPEQAISPQQQERIYQVAAHYQRKLPMHIRLRFDVVAVLKKGGRLEIRHLEGAF